MYNKINQYGLRSEVLAWFLDGVPDTVSRYPFLELKYLTRVDTKNTLSVFFDTFPRVQSAMRQYGLGLRVIH